VVCVGSATAVAVLFVVVPTALGRTGAFGVGDQVAMAALGLVGATVILWFTRPRVHADARGVTVRNLREPIRVPWEDVRAIRFDSGSPWASLILTDDEVLAVLAVQRADGAAAVEVVGQLRALLEASRPAHGPRPADD